MAKTEQGCQASNHAPASNTAAVVTLAAVAGQRHQLTVLAVSYSAAPTGGNVKVEDGSGNTVLSIDITAAGAFAVPLPPDGIVGTSNTAMIITLAAGGTGVSGKVSVAKRTW